jgi:hypothetical protein
MNFNKHSLNANLEQTIHNFFSSIKLYIELVDDANNIYKPKEWFRVKLDVIEEAIKLIIKREISQYIYDDEVKQIVKKR